jgi:hypothetical protein
MAPIGYGPMRWQRMLYHELIDARLLRRYPARFSFHQLYHWGNVFTWYYDALAKYSLMAMPLAYQLGFKPLQAGGGVTFPLLWASNYTTGTMAYLYSMHKAGISPAYAFTSLQGLYFMISPYIAEGLFFIRDEVTGEFKPTLESGGAMPKKYLRAFLFSSGVNVAALALGLGNLQYNANPDSLGLFANTIWPGWNLVLSGTGLGLYAISQARRRD